MLHVFPPQSTRLVSALQISSTCCCPSYRQLVENKTTKKKASVVIETIAICATFVPADRKLAAAVWLVSKDTG